MFHHIGVYIKHLKVIDLLIWYMKFEIGKYPYIIWNIWYVICQITSSEQPNNYFRNISSSIKEVQDISTIAIIRITTNSIPVRNLGMLLLLVVVLLVLLLLLLLFWSQFHQHAYIQFLHLKMLWCSISILLTTLP